MFAEELRGCPQLATVHTHFFRAEWLSQGSAVRTSKMATASSLDVSAPTCFSFGEDRLGTILSASTPGSVESTRELFKDLLSALGQHPHVDAFASIFARCAPILLGCQLFVMQLFHGDDKPDNKNKKRRRQKI